MKNHMIFIVIPKGKYPKTRAQLAKDSKNLSVKNLKVPVYYADVDSKVVFTNADQADAYAYSKGKIASFVEAGNK